MCAQVRIVAERDDLVLTRIKHFYVNVEHEKWKLDTLQSLHETITVTRCIIFVNMQGKVRVTEWIYDVRCIRQSKRVDTFQALKSQVRNLLCMWAEVCRHETSDKLSHSPAWALLEPVEQLHYVA